MNKTIDEGGPSLCVALASANRVGKASGIKLPTINDRFLNTHIEYEFEVMKRQHMCAYMDLVFDHMGLTKGETKVISVQSGLKNDIIGQAERTLGNIKAPE
jgi:hypothetical protein